MIDKRELNIVLKIRRDGEEREREREREEEVRLKLKLERQSGERQPSKAHLPDWECIGTTTSDRIASILPHWDIC